MRLKGGRYEFVHGLSVQCANPLADHLSALKKQESGNVPNTKAPRDGLVVVDVNLADGQLALVVARHLLKDRGDGAARATPGRPKVHQDWDIAADDVILEVGVGGVGNKVAGHVFSRWVEGVYGGIDTSGCRFHPVPCTLLFGFQQTGLG